MTILRDIKSGMEKKEPTKAVATAEAVQMIRDALPDKLASDITSTDLANAVAYYMGQTTDLNDEGLAMVQNWQNIFVTIVYLRRIQRIADVSIDIPFFKCGII